jgi:N,N-dimethylformamidase beta subunit-like protein
VSRLGLARAVPVAGAATLAALGIWGCQAPPSGRGGGGSPVQMENARPGTPGWELRRPAAGREIEGYAASVSVAPGDTLDLHVSTASPRFDIEIYRLGWYGGAGARKMSEIRGLAGHLGETPAPRASDGLIACRWPAGCRLPVGRDWVSGVYLARLTERRTEKQAFIPFVVREPSGPAARRAPLLFQCSVTTWQAYNAWGGRSLYDYNSAGGRRALRVSFDRPYAAAGRAVAGIGAGELLTVSHGTAAGAWEYPMIRWLEKEGYDVAYATDLDTHADAHLFEGRRAFLVVGHDEYWTRAMRRRVEAARDAGLHLGIFGANICYWQIRLEASEEGRRDRVLFCAKEAERDPAVDTAADSALTVRFRDLRPREPEVSLVGMMMSGENVDADFAPLPEARSHWVYGGTGIAAGRTRSLPGLVGYEVDRTFVADSLYARWSPPGLTVLARSPIAPRGGGPTVSEATIYEAPSGALVFSTGTMQWSWGLDDWGAPALRPRRRHPDAERVTSNVLRAFLSRGARAPG